MLFFAFALVAGLASGLQGVLNGRLGTDIGGLQSSLVNFVVGGVLLTVIVLVAGQPSRITPSFFAAHPILLAGGACGVLIVASLVFAVPEIGLSAALVALIAGQLAAAVVLDRVGLFGLQSYPITATRLAGVALCFGGALLVLRR